MGRDGARPGATVFHRWPRTTLAAFFLVFCSALDLAGGVFFIPRDDHSFRTLDLSYHHAFLPLADAWTRWGDARYPFRTNSLGLRDAAPRRVDPRAPGRRVLLIGDSFVEGMGVAWEQSVAGLLDGRAREHGAEVLNAGMVSYSPKLYYLKVRHLLEEQRLTFDELYVFIDISDIFDELVYERFVPDSAGWFTAARYRVDRIMKRRSLLWWSVRTFESRRTQDPVMAAASLWLQSLDNKLLADVSFERGRAVWTVDQVVFDRWGRRGLQLAEGHMEALVRLCAAHGVRLTVVVYPWREQIRAGDRDSVQVHAWKEFAASHGVGFVNLFPLFFDGAAPDAVISRYFIPRDTHWNEAGNRIVADALAPSLGW